MKVYIAVKKVINEIGEVAGVGANCLNESFNCDTTPCLAWNMLFERDNIIFACEGILDLIVHIYYIPVNRKTYYDDQPVPFPGGYGSTCS